MLVRFVNLAIQTNFTYQKASAEGSRCRWERVEAFPSAQRPVGNKAQAVRDRSKAVCSSSDEGECRKSRSLPRKSELRCSSHYSAHLSIEALISHKKHHQSILSQEHNTFQPYISIPSRLLNHGIHIFISTSRCCSYPCSTPSPPRRWE